MKFETTRRIAEVFKKHVITYETKKVRDSHGNEYFEDFMILEKPNQKDRWTFFDETYQNPTISIRNDESKSITFMARIDSGVYSPDEVRLNQFKSTLCQLKNCGFIEAQWVCEPNPYCFMISREKFKPAYLKVVDRDLYICIDKNFEDFDLQDSYSFYSFNEEGYGEVGSVARQVSELRGQRDPEVLHRLHNDWVNGIE